MLAFLYILSGLSGVAALVGCLGLFIISGSSSMESEARVEHLAARLEQCRYRLGAVTEQLRDRGYTGLLRERVEGNDLGFRSRITRLALTLESLEQNIFALRLVTARPGTRTIERRSRWEYRHHLRAIQLLDERASIGNDGFFERFEIMDHLNSLPYTTAMVTDRLADYWARGLLERARPADMARYIHAGRHAIHRTLAGRDTLIHRVYFDSEDEVRLSALRVLWSLKDDPMVRKVMQQVASMQVPAEMHKLSASYLRR